MLRRGLEQAGMAFVSAFTNEIRDGEVDLAAFMRLHRPKVVVCVAPPCEANWQLFQNLQRGPLSKKQIILTSTNPTHAERLAGPHRHVCEVVGKPADLLQIARAIKEVSKSRPTR